jgi:hypothetical protein
LPDKYLHRYRERERVVVVVVVSSLVRRTWNGQRFEGLKTPHQTSTKATTEDAVSGCNDAK